MLKVALDIANKSLEIISYDGNYEKSKINKLNFYSENSFTASKWNFF